MKMANFCYVMLRDLADKYQHFGSTCCLHHHVHHSEPWRWQHRFHSKRLHFPTKLHGEKHHSYYSKYQS